jgi:hypothetical protein
MMDETRFPFFVSSIRPLFPLAAASSVDAVGGTSIRTRMTTTTKSSCESHDFLIPKKKKQESNVPPDYFGSSFQYQLFTSWLAQ